MTRRGDEADAEPLQVIKGIVDRMDFKFAAVARAGIDLADGEAAAEPAQRCGIDGCGQFG